MNLSLYMSEKARKSSEGKAPLVLKAGTLYNSVFKLTPRSVYFLENNPPYATVFLEVADKYTFLISVWLRSPDRAPIALLPIENYIKKEKFYISLTVHLGMIIFNNQLHALFSIYLFISLLCMFRATQCSSSGESNCINTSSGICHCL